MSTARTFRNSPTEAIARWGQAAGTSDDFTMLTSEYSHGYPPSFKSAINHVFPEFHRNPAAFVGYGNIGVARSIEHLRLVWVELTIAPLRHAVHLLRDLTRPEMSDEVFSPETFESLDAELDVPINDQDR